MAKSKINIADDSSVIRAHSNYSEFAEAYRGLGLGLGRLVDLFVAGLFLLIVLLSLIFFWGGDTYFSEIYKQSTLYLQINLNSYFFILLVGIYAYTFIPNLFSHLFRGKSFRQTAKEIIAESINVDINQIDLQERTFIRHVKHDSYFLGNIKFKISDFLWIIFVMYISIKIVYIPIAILLFVLVTYSFRFPISWSKLYYNVFYFFDSNILIVKGKFFPKIETINIYDIRFIQILHGCRGFAKIILYTADDKHTLQYISGAKELTIELLHKNKNIIYVMPNFEIGFFPTFSYYDHMEILKIQPEVIPYCEFKNCGKKQNKPYLSELHYVWQLIIAKKQDEITGIVHIWDDHEDTGHPFYPLRLCDLIEVKDHGNWELYQNAPDYYRIFMPIQLFLIIMLLAITYYVGQFLWEAMSGYDNLSCISFMILFVPCLLGYYWVITFIIRQTVVLQDDKKIFYTAGSIRKLPCHIKTIYINEIVEIRITNKMIPLILNNVIFLKITTKDGVTHTIKKCISTTYHIEKLLKVNPGINIILPKNYKYMFDKYDVEKLLMLVNK